MANLNLQKLDEYYHNSSGEIVFVITLDAFFEKGGKKPQTIFYRDLGLSRCFYVLETSTFLSHYIKINSQG